MVEREIIYSKDAKADIKGIYDYLARGSSQYANSLMKDLYNAIDGLRDFPQKCAVLPQNKRYRLFLEITVLFIVMTKKKKEL